MVMSEVLIAELWKTFPLVSVIPTPLGFQIHWQWFTSSPQIGGVMNATTSALREFCLVRKGKSASHRALRDVLWYVTLSSGLFHLGAES